MNNNSASPHLSQQLFESGPVCWEQTDDLPIEINRGMTILTSEGQEAGKVAAVVFDYHNPQVTHLLLICPGLIPDYRLVPVDLIKQVSKEMVWLHIDNDMVDSLPHRHVET